MKKLLQNASKQLKSPELLQRIRIILALKILTSEIIDTISIQLTHYMISYQFPQIDTWFEDFENFHFVKLLN